jgi:hypothetical protein
MIGKMNPLTARDISVTNPSAFDDPNPRSEA